MAWVWTTKVLDHRWGCHNLLIGTMPAETHILNTIADLARPCQNPMLCFEYDLSPPTLTLKFNPHCEVLRGGTKQDLQEVIRAQPSWMDYFILGLMNQVVTWKAGLLLQAIQLFPECGASSYHVTPWAVSELCREFLTARELLQEAAPWPWTSRSFSWTNLYPL